MSTLTGHWEITAEAVRQLAADWKSDPLVQGLNAAALPGAAITRDILDVLSGGHWADFGQKHHFMRKFDGQSPYRAYCEAVTWIHDNALESVRALANLIHWYFPKGIVPGAPGANRQGRAVFANVSWQPLGNAIHALEDSFAAGHVLRGPPINVNTPGSIEHVKRYAGSEKEGHEHGDEAWRNADNHFTRDGLFAIRAVKQLLLMVILSAQQKRTSGKAPMKLLGWEQFVDKWLKASSKLSKQGDKVFDLIDRHYTGVRLGAKNLKTLNLNEEGLAKTLFQEVGSDTQTTLDVFVRLDEHFNSDADDVAEIYVNLVRSKGGGVLAALRSNKALIQRLIKVMDEGWTTSGESDCIRFLRGLI